METIIATVLGFIAIIAAYFIGTIKNKGTKNPFESNNEYINRRKKKHEEELDKMPDADIVDKLDNTDDVRATIDRGKGRLKDLFQRGRVPKPKRPDRKTP